MKEIFISILFCLNLLIILNEDCSNFDDEYLCEEEETSYNEKYDEDAFQTPPRNDIYGRHRKTYQDMHYLVGYTQLKYSLDQKSCTVKIITRVNKKLGNEGIDYYFNYKFGESIVREDNITLYAEKDSYPKGMPISAIIIDIKTKNEIVRLDLEDEYFIWDNPEVSQSEEYENGLRGSIVELFGWPYEDIAEECEFLGHSGYMGVKVYSPNEHILTYDLVENNVVNPWWYMTQTVSYKLESRLGDKKQLKYMINTCRKYNVRVYAGVVINHMTGGGNDMYDDHRTGNSQLCTHWGPKTGSAGSPYWTVSDRFENNSYTGKRPVLEYPSIPYFPSDFHCKLDIEDWFDIDQLVNGWLAGMADVNLEKDYVQQRIADYFTELQSLGMSGISIANGKQMLPESIAKIFKKVKENFGGEFPKDFLGVIQIQYGNQKDITMCDDESKLSYGVPFKEKLEELGFSEEEITHIKIWNTDFLNGDSPYCEDDEEWKVDPTRVVISTEYTDDINLANDYNIYVRDKNIEIHRDYIVDMFAIDENDFKIRNVFSMFSLYKNSNGFPDGKSDCSVCQTDVCKNGCTKSFPYRKAYNPLSVGYDTGDESNWIEGEYTRVHRDKDIINAMREWMGFEEMTENELYDGERQKANCEEKCLTCNDESKKENLCLSCNKTGGYYPVIYPGHKDKYYECYRKDLKYERLYFDEKQRFFKPCYETCKMCSKEGTSQNHNCEVCEHDLIQRPSEDYPLNCVANCTFNYYFTPFGHYKCSEIEFCPKEACFLIKEKNKCIDDCKNDRDYPYLYNGNCLKECPDNTIKDNYICKNKNSDVCTLSEKQINLKYFYNEKVLNSIVRSYRDEFKYTQKHILRLNNIGYEITIFKDYSCIDYYSLQLLKIDYDICYNKVKNYYKIEEDLIIVYIELYNIYDPINGYILFNPVTGLQLNFKNICNDITTSKIEDNDIILLEEDKGTDEEVAKCNKNFGLYPVVFNQQIDNKCYNKSQKYNGIYFDENDNVFKPCYESCKRCDREGNSETHNCLECETDYIPRPGSTSTLFNCVTNCTYSYYFSDYGQYKCTDIPFCPIEVNKFIESKKKCIKDCRNDPEYKYLFNGLCLEKCPENTINNNFICIIKNHDICTFTSKELSLKNFGENGGMNAVVVSYMNEFTYTNKHISLLINPEFKLIIYKDQNCYNEFFAKDKENSILRNLDDDLTYNLPTIDFQDCYEKIKNFYNIKGDLIVALLENDQYKNPFTSYSLYHPQTGEKLNGETICQNLKITVKENILSLLEKNNISPEKIEDMTKLMDQNINIFNKTEPFYSDICFHFESPNNRDITLKDRLLEYYPNITLCDPGCENKGVDSENGIAICECKFNDIINNEQLLENNLIGDSLEDALDIITNMNLEVLKCIKDSFKYFKNSIGGILIITGIGLCIPLTIIFFLIDLNKIKKYIIGKTDDYINYLSDATDKINNSKDDDFKNIKIDIKQVNYSNSRSKYKNRISKIDLKGKDDSKQDSSVHGKDILSVNRIHNSSKDILSNNKAFINKNMENKIKEKDKSKKEKEKLKHDFKEYLETDLNDLDFDDALKKDERGFCEYFCDSVIEKQKIVNTFFLNEPLRPRSIKIILFILILILYFVINGLFFSEDYISEIYHLEAQDSFFSFVPRSINRFIYSALVSYVISFIIDCFFPEEKKIKGIFNREKENIVNLKFEIGKFIKKIKKRYISFIIFVYLISLFFLFYLLCFNYVYPNTQIEWIKSSIMLMIIMELVAMLASLAETLLRFVGLMLKSEKIFRLSKLLE